MNYLAITMDTRNRLATTTTENPMSLGMEYQMTVKEEILYRRHRAYKECSQLIELYKY